MISPCCPVGRSRVRRGLERSALAIAAATSIVRPVNAQDSTSRHPLLLAAAGPRFISAPTPKAPSADVSNAPAFQRRVTLEFDRVPLAAALGQVAKQAGLHFGASQELVSLDKSVSMSATNITVGAALFELLSGMGIDVQLYHDGATMVLVPRTNAPLAKRQQGTGSLTGRVTDAASGAPVADASVYLADTRYGGATSADGAYTIARVPAGAYVANVRRVGYATLSVRVTVTADSVTRHDFPLQRAAQALDQVVVTAAGNGRSAQEGNTRDIVTAEDFKNAPVSDPQAALTARVPGLTILANGGAPGAGGTIRLRGVNSVEAGNSPIIYVDGARIYDDLIYTGFGGRQGYLPLNDISASDIDHIEVVKGAAATTLYGTQASGGVIQIFTKRGQNAGALWTTTISGGVNNMGHLGPSESPTGMFMNVCRGPQLVNAFGRRWVDPSCPSSGTWFRNGPIGRFASSVRGGAGQLSYFISGNYNDESGVTPDAHNQQGGFRGNFAFAPTKRWDFTFTSSYTKRNTRWTPDGDSRAGLFENVARGNTGHFIGGLRGQCAGVDTSAVCVVNGNALMARDFSYIDHFTTGLTTTYHQSQAITHRFTLGYDFNTNVHDTEEPFGFPQYPPGYIYDFNRRHTLVSAEYAATWQAQVTSALASTLSVGAQAFRDVDQYLWTFAQNFGGPGIPTLTSAGITQIQVDSNPTVVNGGFFVQEIVGLQDRLFVTGGLRVDGNSTFGTNYGLQSYPKVSASYVLSTYDWWPKWWSSMKLRTAYGVSGKSPGAFAKLATWQSVPADSGHIGFVPSQIGNPKLGPERTAEFEGGFDAGFLAERVAFQATAFHARTTHALLPVITPPSLGFGGFYPQLENVGTIRSSGVELHANVAIIQGAALGWSVRTNYSIVNSGAVNIAGESINEWNDAVVAAGLPVPAYFGWKVMNPAAIADPIINPLAPLGRVFPNRLVSLGTALTLGRRLALDALAEGQYGGHLENTTVSNLAFHGVWAPCYAVQRQLAAFAAGDANALNSVTALQRAKCTTDPTLSFDTFWIQPTDFVKLRNVSVTYQLPVRGIGRFTSASVTLAGRNLATWTTYKGVDPEAGDVSEVLGTGGMGRRDVFNLPQTRSFLATVNLSY